ncbi:MAG TPA: undecaprenyl-diphosphate phosphatase [Chromatiales bacterium]|nr:undecaprenyl-diphosphate phosphatase [Chromatiales bacterium]
MDFVQVTVLAVVQGLTEFLPISSSAHLILVPVLTGWPDQGLAFDVSVHVGTLAAVVWYFRDELWAMAEAWIRSLRGVPSPDARLAWGVLLGTIPVGLAGLLFGDFIEARLRSPLVIAAATLVFGLALGWADWAGRRERDEHQLRWTDVLWIGLAQAVALIPGTSRSGITMTAGLALGLTREGSARFSFLLSIPVIVLAGGYEALKLTTAPDAVHWGVLALGASLSGLSAYVCIALFLRLLERVGMWPFVVYRMVLGLVLLALFL